jgi:hypothetical protein
MVIAQFKQLSSSSMTQVCSSDIRKFAGFFFTIIAMEAHKRMKAPFAKKP